jgi:hypothetical protein
MNESKQDVHLVDRELGTKTNFSKEPREVQSFHLLDDVIGKPLSPEEIRASKRSTFARPKFNQFIDQHVYN